MCPQEHSLPALTQGLLIQMVTNWRVLAPGIKPRALWAIGHHLHLHRQLGDPWRALLEALTLALQGGGQAAQQLQGFMQVGRLWALWAGALPFSQVLCPEPAASFLFQILP